MKFLSILTIFLGSFLLFLVQPMVGNLLLPVFGGTATVWIVCLCVFQTLLVAGYMYAHVMGELVRVGSGMRWVHISLIGLCGGVILLNVGPWISLASVAILYTVIGANAALVQRLVASDRGTYRLYAVSNIGSFVGLIVFPFVVELLLPTSSQLRWYALGVMVYAVLLAILMTGGVRSPSGPSIAKVRFGVLSGIGWREALPWFLLSAASCFVLDGLTSHLCQDVSPLPLLWCALLAIYLLSWTIAFNETGSRIGRWLGLVVFGCIVLQVLHSGHAAGIDYVFELVVSAVLLLSGCWYIHSHLYIRRPDVGKLTAYYFLIALGGAAGGIAATLAIPMAFDFVAEYPLSQILLLILLAYNGQAWIRAHDKGTDRLVRLPYAIGVACVLAAVVVWRCSDIPQGIVLVQSRNFYGTTKVTKCFPDGPSEPSVNGKEGETLVTFRNNGTLHGTQFAVGSWRRYAPTTYYSEAGGGMAVLNHPAYRAGHPLRVAILGMGIGTMAYYGRTGDVYRFYEINPNVVNTATNAAYYTYLSESKAKIEISVGDARKRLEEEVCRGDERYDLIVVDVFSGDSIPAHLATVEAMKLYVSRLAHGGIIAMHLSNWHLDLMPVAKALSESQGLEIRAISSLSKVDDMQSYWAYLSRDPLELRLNDEQREIDISHVRDCPAPTDDHHSLLPHIRMISQEDYRYL